MKITKSELRKIIREEIQNIFSEEMKNEEGDCEEELDENPAVHAMLRKRNKKK